MTRNESKEAIFNID